MKTNSLTKVLSGNSAMIYSYALNHNSQLTREQLNQLVDAIIKKGNAQYLYLFTVNIVGLTYGQLNKLTEAICKTNNLNYICKFAIDVLNLTENHYKKLMDSICNYVSVDSSLAAVYIYMAATKILGLPSMIKNQLAIYMANTKQPYYIYHFIVDVIALTKENQDLLVETLLQTDEVYYVMRVVTEVTWMLDTKHISLIARYLAIKEAYSSILALTEQAVFLPDEAITILLPIICSSHNAEYIYRFAVSLSNLSIDDKKTLAHTIYNTGNIEMIQKFDQDVYPFLSVFTTTLFDVESPDYDIDGDISKKCKQKIIK